MSAVLADPNVGAVPAKRGKRKLIVIVAAALVLLLGIGGGAAVYLKKAAQAAAEAGGEDALGDERADAATPAIDAKIVPVYLPLDPFVVNLADKEIDRYVQIGITLELDTNVGVERIKAYMPAIRNAILLLIASKSAHDLIDRAGKEQLADEIMRESVRPMGIDIAAPEPVTTAASSAVGPSEEGASAATAAPMKAKAKVKRETQRNPIRRVHFSSFIIQ